MKKAILIDSTLAQYTAEDFSWLQKFFLQAGVLADSAGILGLGVSQRAAGANMSVDVAIGNALIDFTKNATNWKIIGLSNAIENVVIPTQASGANRVGAIIMRASITVEPNTLKNNIITIEFIPGTGTSPLSDGAITTAISGDMFIRLANITVPTGATSIVTGNIADTRVQCKTNEAIKLAPQTLNFSVLASDPTTPSEGQVWYNSTTHTLNFYNNSTVKQLGSTQGGFNPFVISAQATPNMTVAVASGEVKFGNNPIHFAGANSPQFINPGFAYDIEIAVNPANGEDITIVINSTSIVFHCVSAIGSTAGNFLRGATAAETRANLLGLINNPGVTSATQVALSAPNQALMAYVKGTDDLTLKIFVEAISTSLTSLSMSETMTGSGNVVTANTTKDRIDVLYLDNTGTLVILRGAYSASPVAPTYPLSVLVLAEIYCRCGMTSIKATDDSSNGYIYRDARGFQVQDITQKIPLIAGEAITATDALVLSPYTQYAGKIMFDNQDAIAYSPTTNPTRSFTVGNNPNRAMLIGITCSSVPTSVTYNSVAATLIDSQLVDGGVTLYVYKLIAPTTGANNVVVTAPNVHSLAITSYYNVDQYTPTDVIAKALANNISITTVSNCSLVHFFGARYHSSGGGSPTVSGAYTTKYSAGISPTSVAADGAGGSVGISSSTTEVLNETQATTVSALIAYGSGSVTEAIFAIGLKAANAPTFGVLKSNTSPITANEPLIDFIGFADSTVAAGASVNVTAASIVTGLSGLIAGKKYYLQNTAGAIGTARGNYGKLIGVALSATTLLIAPEKTMGGAITKSAAYTYTAECDGTLYIEAVGSSATSTISTGGVSYFSRGVGASENQPMSVPVSKGNGYSFTVTTGSANISFIPLS